MHKNRDLDARKAIARLTNTPVDSAIVDRQAKDISIALEAERAAGSSSYAGAFSRSFSHSGGAEAHLVPWACSRACVDCFRNNDIRNGLRTWTGILLQGVCLFFFLPPSFWFPRGALSRDCPSRD